MKRLLTILMLTLALNFLAAVGGAADSRNRRRRMGNGIIAAPVPRSKIGAPDAKNESAPREGVRART